jgi:hypothetical protein
MWKIEAFQLEIFSPFLLVRDKSTDIVELSLIESVFRSLLVKTFFDVTCELIRAVEEIMS